MEKAPWARVRALIKLAVGSFAISFIVIFVVIFMGWADEPLNAYFESGNRKDMSWLSRTVYDLGGPHNLMARLRREDFELFRDFGLIMGFSGGLIISGLSLIADGIFGWTKSRS